MEKIISKPLTLSGRYFSKKDLAQVQQTIKSFPNLSITELAQTICEHISWVTPKGRNKINSCLTALEKLEQLGCITLPKKRPQKKRETKKIIWSKQTHADSTIECLLEELGSVKLKVVKEKPEVDLWNEYVDRYHYLGYKHPIGAALKYFIISNKPEEKILGCFLFSSSVWHLADRDSWIGWEPKEREKRLKLVVNNSRFLIFPWVKVPNLASKTLSMASKQLADDWQEAHAYRPVLVETFVDPSRYSGACYRAANWEPIGQTSGKDWSQDSEPNAGEKDKKDRVKLIFVYPLQSNFKAILCNRKPKRQNQQIKVDEQFVTLWGKVVAIISLVAQDFDKTWLKRRRVIDSLLLVFLIFRLVFSKNGQGYGTIISDFWFNCHQMEFPLTQKKPISASSFTDARKKLDETIFKVLNSRIVEAYDNDDSHYRWFGHRLFAVDGSKLNLPRNLTDEGYQLKSQIPYDFDLVSHGNERQCALAHLSQLSKEDVVVYDRGYFSYAMLYYHVQSAVHPIFRLQKNSFKEIKTFQNSEQIDQVITLMPSKETQHDIKKKYPSISFMPIKIRLIKYTIGDTTYCLGTTLMNEAYTPNDFKAVYHSRWGIEELYKISKQMIVVDDFHGKSERTVKQELFAHFVLITMSRLCSNESETILSSFLKASEDGAEETVSVQVNFKNCLATVSRHLENFMFVPAQSIKQVMDDMVSSISRYHQKLRPGRSYVRKSMKPVGKWRFLLVF